MPAMAVSWRCDRHDHDMVQTPEQSSEAAPDVGAPTLTSATHLPGGLAAIAMVVAIVVGVGFIVAVTLFSGFALSCHAGGPGPHVVLYRERAPGKHGALGATARRALQFQRC